MKVVAWNPRIAGNNLIYSNEICQYSSTILKRGLHWKCAYVLGFHQSTIHNEGEVIEMKIASF